MNRIITYFKQAWTLIRQEKIFSAIYIVGTGLSITVVMALAIIFYLKIANIYPETNRDRLLSITSASMTRKVGEQWFYSSTLSLSLINDYIATAEHAEAVAIMHGYANSKHYLQKEVTDEQQKVTVKMVNTAFWTVFPFRFLEGKPFSDEEFNSGVPVAVVSESLSRKLFGAETSVGRSIYVDFKEFRICGVVRDASFITSRTYAQVWMPYSAMLNDDKDNYTSAEDLLGGYIAFPLARSAKDIKLIKNEIDENIRRLNLTLTDYELSLNGQPDRQWQSIFRFYTNVKLDFTKIILQYALIFLILLLIPAVSLSGMTESRMERRLAEMGIRRAFGAPVGRLMRQIISENFVFTALGGVFGLVLSYLIIIVGRSWILHLGQQMTETLPAAEILITPSMLFNLPVFVIALGVCFILNLMCAVIPAWRASRKAIVYSLNNKNS